MEAYLISICIIALIYALLAVGLNIQYGETGLINFGHVAYFAIGAYASSIMAQQGVPVSIAIVFAGVVATFTAIPIGYAALRLREEYFAIVTLGFAETVRLFIQQESWLTNGVQGISSIPRLIYFNSSSIQNYTYFLILLIIVLSILVLVRLLQASPFGRILRAIRENEVSVVSLGKQTSGFKIKVLMFGSFLAGISGAFYAHFITYISPEQFISIVTFYVWMSIILGGVGT